MSTPSIAERAATGVQWLDKQTLSPVDLPQQPWWLTAVVVVASVAVVSGLIGLALWRATKPLKPAPRPGLHRADGPTRQMRREGGELAPYINPQPQPLRLVEDIAVSARDPRGNRVWEFIDPQGGEHR